jgi:hypothetical protein
LHWNPLFELCGTWGPSDLSYKKSTADSQSCNDDNTEHFNGKNAPVCGAILEDQPATLPIAAQAANADEGETAGQRIDIMRVQKR